MKNVIWRCRAHAPAGGLLYMVKLFIVGCQQTTVHVLVVIC